MLKDKEISKLRLNILNSIYQNKCLKNIDLSTLTIYPIYLNKKYDEHDLDIVMNDLVVNGYVTKFDDEIPGNIIYPITQKGIDYCNINSNKIKKFLLSHTFDIFNLIVAIIMGILGIIF